MDIICVEHPYLGQYTKSFLVPGPGGGVLIDTGLSSGARRIAALAPRPEAVLSTHGHWDHTGGHRFFQARGALYSPTPATGPSWRGRSGSGTSSTGSSPATSTSRPPGGTSAAGRSRPPSPPTGSSMTGSS